MLMCADSGGSKPSKATASDFRSDTANALGLRKPNNSDGRALTLHDAFSARKGCPVTGHVLLEEP